MPSIWATLTPRGRLVALAAVGICVAAVVLRERDLLWLGVALLGVVLAALLIVRQARPCDTVRRTVTPAMTPVDTVLRVAVEVRGARRRGWGVRLYEDDLPARLGAAPRFRLRPAGDARLGYALRPGRRGRYAVGPLAVDVRDPFGLARVDFAHGTRSTVLVTPAVEELPPGLFGGDAAPAGAESPQRFGTAGDDDVLVREYRHGDSMRRIHWRSSARAGELMVRREEQTGDQAATILLDDRAAPHAGDGPDDSLEWMVSAAASLAHGLRRADLRTEIVDADGLLVRGSTGPANGPAEREVLATLAEVTCVDTPTLARAADSLAGSSTRLVVALLAQCSPLDAVQLTEAAGRRRDGIALLLATDQFGAPHGRRELGGVALLAERGWRVVQVERGESLGEVLARAGGTR